MRTPIPKSLHLTLEKHMPSFGDQDINDFRKQVNARVNNALGIKKPSKLKILLGGLLGGGGFLGLAAVGIAFSVGILALNIWVIVTVLRYLEVII